MNEQYITLVGKVCAPRYENVFTPEVRSELPIEASSEGRNLKDWEIIGNNEPNHIDESEGMLPLTTKSATAGAALDWRIDGNNIPQVESTTEVLPLTFPSNGDNVTDYTIYGNNNPCEPEQTSVLPITFETVENKLRDWSISGNDDVGENICGEYIELATINASGEVINNNNYDIGLAQVERDKTYSFYRFASDVNAIYAFYESKPVIGGVSYNNARAVSSSLSGSFTAPITGWVAFCIQSNTGKNLTITKGSTAPDHYIPYQQGVGERTENKLPAPVNGTYTNNRTTVTVTDGVYHIVQVEGSGSSNIFIDIPEFEIPDSGYIICLNSVGYSNATFVFRYNSASLSGGYAFTPANRIITIGSDLAGKKANQIQIYTTGSGAMDFTIAPMITDSNTYTAYIPYGYKIPISTQGKNLFDKSNLVIGSYYTAQGQTGNSDDWSRTVNAIPVQPSTEYTFEPNSTAGASAKHLYLDADKNFISAIASGGSTFTTPSNCYYIQFSLRTSSTNVMLVKGSTAPQTYIPYFHNDYTFYIGSTPLIAGQSISKTSTGVDITTQVGENTISTTLYNKPVMYCGKALGVGIPTENLFAPPDSSFTVSGVDIIYLNSVITLHGTTTSPMSSVNAKYKDKTFILPAGEYTYSRGTIKGAIPALYNAATDTSIVGLQEATKTFTLVEDTTVYIGFYAANNTAIDITVYIMLVNGSTAPASYIPHGYKVPITITDENSNTTEQTFYIGNSRLLSGDTYTKTQAGIDIPTTSGNNIISTTLYNKPQMNVVCNSNVLGVGLKSENLFDDSKVESGYLSTNGGIVASTSTNTSGYIAISGGYDYTIRCERTTTISSTNARAYGWFDASKQLIGSTGAISFGTGAEVITTTITAPANAAYLRFSFDVSYTKNMVVRGSTAPSTYSPMGYSLPITVIGENLFDDSQFGVNTSSDTVVYIPVATGAGTFTLSTSTPLAGAARCVFLLAGNVSRGASNTANGIYNGVTRTVTAVDGFVTVAYRNVSSTKPGNYDTMLVRGSTAPSTYIPYTATNYTFQLGSRPLAQGQSISKSTTHSDITLYSGVNNISTSLDNKPNMMVEYVSGELGVGVRTEQLFADTVGKQVITAAAGTTLSAGINNPMTLAAGHYTIHYYQSTSMTSNIRNTLSVLTVATGVQTYESSKTNHHRNAGWYSWTFDIPTDGSYQMRIWINNASSEVKATNFILTKGETVTPTSYIPYGYQIPIDIKQDDEVVDHKDIYIGTQPLVEGASVSKVSVGEDIALVSGKNYIDTDLFNKPEMYIK